MQQKGAHQGLGYENPKAGTLTRERGGTEIQPRKPAGERGSTLCPPPKLVRITWKKGKQPPMIGGKGQKDGGDGWGKQEAKKVPF